MDDLGDRQRLKWRAFGLGLLVPGLGQIFRSRISGLIYLAAALGIANITGLPISLRWAVVGSLTLIGAERARRDVEYGGHSRPAGFGAIGVRIQVPRFSGRRIGLDLELDVPRSVEQVWERMADLRRFVRVDPFHSRLIVLGANLEAGVELAIEHRAFGLRFLRFGKLLSWREGKSYAISDLAASGSRGFFPHVFTFAIEPIGPARSRLTVRVRGRWNSPIVPTWAGRLWVRFIGREHARLLRVELAKPA